jgi:hypothetical protein
MAREVIRSRGKGRKGKWEAKWIRERNRRRDGK